MPGSSLSIISIRVPSSCTVGDQPDTFGVCIGFGVDQIVVSVSGELDIATAPKLGSLLDVVTEQPFIDVVLDLSELEFVDVVGLRVITATSTRLRPQGRALTLRSVPPSAQRVIDLTGAGDLVDIQAPNSEQSTGDRSSHVIAEPGIGLATAEVGDRLQGVLLVREVIAQAQGVLMERTGVSAEEAAVALHGLASDAGGSVRTSADAIVASTRRQIAPSP